MGGNVWIQMHVGQSHVVPVVHAVKQALAGHQRGLRTTESSGRPHKAVVPVAGKVVALPAANEAPNALPAGAVRVSRLRDKVADDAVEAAEVVVLCLAQFDEIGALARALVDVTA